MASDTQIGDGFLEGGPWLSITELADLKGVSKPTISEKVSRLEREEGLTTRSGPGNTKLVNLAEYDRLLGETSDLAKLQGAATARARRGDETAEESATPPADASFSDVQKRKTQYEAGLKALEYGERTRQLVPAADARRDAEKISDVFLGSIDTLVLRSDEITAAALKDGVSGVRQVLKDTVFKLRAAIAQAFAELATLNRNQDAGGVDVDLEMQEGESP